MSKSWIFVATVGAAPGILPLRASATRNVNLPGSGTATIGSINGDQWVGFQPIAGGPCQWFYLGSGGLTDNVQVFGSSSSDWIQVAVANASNSCGRWQPLIYNGHYINEFGGAGADVIFGGFNTDQTYGGDGDDLVVGDWFGGLIVGDGGNDALYGHDTPRDFFSGADGDDRICEHSGTTALFMDGSVGYDTRCGTASYAPSGFEAVNCSVCGSGY
jgi:hypothetical protein